MNPNEQYSQSQGGQQASNNAAANAFQSSAPVGPAIGQVPLGQVDPRMLAPLPKKRSLGSLVTIIILSILLVSAIGFGIWAFMGRQDYKTNSDQKSATAVEQAKEAQKIALDAEFIEKEKLPYDTYSGPAAAGSIKIQYPKTWSAYVVEDSQSATPVVGYFHPGYVPNTVNNVTSMALRLEVANQPYEQVMLLYESFIKNGQITAAAASFPSVPNVLGTRLSGQILLGNQKVQGTMVVLPLRDKTVKLWTESNSAFLGDFDTAILPSFVFVP